MQDCLLLKYTPTTRRNDGRGPRGRSVGGTHLQAAKILLTLLFCTVFPRAWGADGMAYLWHRVRGNEQTAALKPFSGWKIYALHAEIRRDKPAVLLKHLPGTVPVIRLDQFCWREEDFLKTFLLLLSQLPPGEIQLDCDVPESKLGDYGSLLKKLKEEDTAHTFSITLLPCHLKHPALKTVLNGIDYAVLQLHALEIPESLPREYKLFDPEAADQAVQAMKKLSVPFKIALPSYAYTIHYTADGGFRRISAENEPPPQRNEIRRVACPDWKTLLEFRRKHPELEVIWFRLPQPGDRLALEEENLIRLNQGKMPRTEIETVFKQNGACTDIYWKNHGLPGRVSHIMPLGGSGEIFFFNGAEPEGECISGTVPRTVKGVAPAPGETLLIAKILNWRKDKND